MTSNDTQTQTIVYGWVTVCVTNPLESHGIVTRIEKARVALIEYIAKMEAEKEREE